jgi:hypothetical protein
LPTDASPVDDEWVRVADLFGDEVWTRNRPAASVFEFCRA